MHYDQTISVIGAGIMGLCAAYILRQKFPAALVSISDPGGFPADNASRMAGGMLTPYSEIEHMPRQLIRAALKGIEFWRGLGLPTCFRQTGSLVIAHEDDMHMLERFHKLLKAHNVKDYSVEDRAGVQALEPCLPARFQKGIYLGEEGFLDPALTMKSLAGAVNRRPTHHNDADWVIDCRGYDAAYDDPDLRGVKGETLLVRNPDFALSRPVRLMHPRYPLYIVPRADHVFMIGATQIEGADEEMSLKGMMELGSALYSLHPSFAEASVLESRAGLRPAYPDNLPRITVSGNIIRCNGLFRHGYLLSPVMAECVADYIAGRENEYAPLFKGGNIDGYHHQRREEKLRSTAQPV